ncbi:putative membrane protein [Clostridium cavendishii DSM 21758]|uniref:Putative membrane protein n=1 Tax=Clostridium cavendishii DSM 21758 TaxID=1121302 RepID=A0A1M6BAZ8_9CLOT|nr:hypothetical protein [Clostridium cavendishii]SHI45738.1 putative membrane protein [Clostridium cavendishii DSM 21758]
MRRKAMSKKVIALTLLATMVVPQVAYGKELTKDEAVYVTMDSNGKIDKKIVSDWIHSETSGTIIDKSNLKDIKNVKGEEKPNIDGDTLTWNVKDNDVYYQGNTDKELPLSIDVKYYLDDKETAPQDISGKNGKFKITIEFTNNDAHKVNVGGVERTLYTPIATAAVVNLPDKNFKNIKTDGGSVLSDGNNNIITFATIPGIRQSLGLDEVDLNLGVDFKDKIEITGEANNFKLGSIMITATPKIGEVKELSNIQKLDDLKKALGDLKDSSTKLADGGKKLSDSVNLADSKLQDILKKLDSKDNKSKLDLIKNSDKVNLSRKLIDDALVMEKMDTSLLEQTSSLMTNQNIAISNKLYKDINDINYENLMNGALIQKLQNVTSNQNIQKNLDALNSLLEDKALIDGSITDEKLNTIYGLLDLFINNLDGLKQVMNLTENISNADLSSLDKVDLILKNADAINAKLDSVAVYSKDLADLNNKLNAMISNVNKASNAAVELDKNKIAADQVVSVINASNLQEAQKQGLIGYVQGSKAFIGEMAKSLPQTEAFMKEASTKLNSVNADLNSEQSKAIIATLKTMLAQENIKKIQGMLGELKYSQKLLQDNKVCLSTMNKVMNGINKEDLMKVKKLSTKITLDIKKNQDNIDLLMTASQALKDPTSATLFNKIKVIKEDIDSLEPIVKAINSNMTQENINKIMNSPQMIKQLLSMKQDLIKSDEILNITNDALREQNIKKANDMLNNMPTLLSGIKELKNGANMLSDGLGKFNTEGIDKLDSEGTEKLDKIKRVADSANELVKISNDYSAFSGATDNMESKVKFIYKTQEIKGKEVKNEEKIQVKEEKKGFIAWIKSIFSK